MKRWHLVETRFMIMFGLACAVAGGLGATLIAEVARPAHGHVINRTPDLSDVWVLPQPAHEWDLVDPWQRCMAAMESAEIPGDMWVCYEPSTLPAP